MGEDDREHAEGPDSDSTRGPGRPSFLEDADIVGRLKSAIEMGLSIKFACAYAGVSESALGNWQRSDAAVDPSNPDWKWSDEIASWKAEGMVHHLEVLRGADAMDEAPVYSTKSANSRWFLGTRGSEAGFVEKKAVEHDGSIDVVKQLAELPDVPAEDWEADDADEGDE